MVLGTGDWGPSGCGRLFPLFSFSGSIVNIGFSIQNPTGDEKA